MYSIFGYDDLMRYFSFEGLTFCKAVRLYMDLDSDGLNVVFIDGISDAVRLRLQEIFFLGD